jgi:hypothetical protein
MAFINWKEKKLRKMNLLIKSGTPALFGGSL